MKIKYLKDQKQPILPLFLVMLFVTAKLICNAWFMNHVELDLGFVTLQMTQSAFSYGLVFILLDLIFIFYGRRNALYVIFLGMLMDGVYSGALYTTHLWVVPAGLSQPELATTLASHVISERTWWLFFNGIIASAITYVLELFLFALLFDKVFKKKLFLASVTSVGITLAIHNGILYSRMFKGDPDLWRIYFSNYAMDMTFVFMYAVVVSVGVWLYSRKCFRQSHLAL